MILENWKRNKLASNSEDWKIPQEALIELYFRETRLGLEKSQLLERIARGMFGKESSEDDVNRK